MNCVGRSTLDYGGMSPWDFVREYARCYHELRLGRTPERLHLGRVCKDMERFANAKGYMFYHSPNGEIGLRNKSDYLSNVCVREKELSEQLKGLADTDQLLLINRRKHNAT